MTRKRNAPGPAKTESVGCLHDRADTDAYSIAAARCQYLRRLGISQSLAAIVAPMAFGEAHHG